MLPPDFGPLAARQLVAAATRAWVFGGMGSWNDVWFANPALVQRYKALTPALFEAVLSAIVDGANAGVVPSAA
jgi:hypothetical protein